MKTSKWVDFGSMDIEIHVGMNAKFKLPHGIVHVKNPQHKIDCGYEVRLIPNDYEQYRHYTNVFEGWILMIQKAVNDPEQFKEESVHWEANDA